MQNVLSAVATSAAGIVLIQNVLAAVATSAAGIVLMHNVLAAVATSAAGIVLMHNVLAAVASCSISNTHITAIFYHNLKCVTKNVSLFMFMRDITLTSNACLGGVACCIMCCVLHQVMMIAIRQRLQRADVCSYSHLIERLAPRARGQQVVHKVTYSPYEWTTSRTQRTYSPYECWNSW